VRHLFSIFAILYFRIHSQLSGSFASNGSTLRLSISSTVTITTNNNNISVGTGTVTAATFTGALSGNATTATTATNLTNAANITTGTINSDRLPVATDTALGGVKKGNNINIADDGTISVDLLSYSGDSTINGDLVVNSNLIVHGTSTRLNTDIYTTERLEITNAGPGISFTLKQTSMANANNILSVSFQHETSYKIMLTHL
jgi:hypothetical protein